MAHHEECDRREKGNCIDRMSVIVREPDKRIIDVNIQTEQTSKKEIMITPEAAKEIQRIRKENQIPDSHALRIGVKSGGCCGMSYLLAFDNETEETDKVIQTEGLTVFIDTQSLAQLSGTTLEFVNGPHGSGFRFDNPNAEGSCSCDDGCCE
jgi:iron-sulfur cluster assembly protein